MGQVIQKHVITKEGELDVVITLNLNINLNQNDQTNISTCNNKPISDNKVKLEIPDFETPTELIDFG